MEFKHTLIFTAGLAVGLTATAELVGWTFVVLIAWWMWQGAELAVAWCICDAVVDALEIVRGQRGRR